MKRLATITLALALAAPALAQDAKDATKKDDAPPAPAPRAKISLADFEDAVLDVADRVRPAVVAIDARHEGDESHVIAPRRVSLSGVIWDADGLVVALGRDLEAASSIAVTPLEGEPLKATLLGVDEETGVAVLKVDDEKKRLKPLAHGATDRLRAGSFVVTVGNPLGLKSSVGFGTVAGVGRTVKRGPFVTKDAIQITVPVNPGDPGGLVADSHGRMIGVLASALRRADVGIDKDLIETFRRGLERFFPGAEKPDKKDEKATAPSDKPTDKSEKKDKDHDEMPGLPKELRDLLHGRGPARRLLNPDELLGAQGISFALTVEEVAHAVERVKKDGNRARPVLGVDVLTMDDGVIVTDVRDGSPAARADLRAKDVILTYNGQAVRDGTELRHRVRESALGAEVKIEILREGARVTLAVKLDTPSEDADGRRKKP